MPKPASLAAQRQAPPEPTGEELGELLGVVAERTGVDLRAQRAPMLARRAAMRLSAAGAGSTSEYLARLRDDLAEPWRLLERLTIKVSRLFRDPGAFAILRERAIPELRRRRGAAELRAWSAGCAHGEEAYGLAILLAGSGGPWSVLATDVDRSALTRARAGRYAREEAAHVPAELAAEHLLPSGDEVRVVPALARNVRFAAHDLASPAPPPGGGAFDLVACRNVLIYFLPDRQAAVLSRVVDRIAPRGWLLLGETEWPPRAVARQLEVIDRTHRLFRVRPADGRAS
ncbi:MAG TPA: protein-glutamate O-methyltransferase CheR [Anaeromyxobacter sp.]|nr:protein-glutamate O-methyltransferase CheR [Anaeromyxobacter sp.]